MMDKINPSLAILLIAAANPCSMKAPVPTILRVVASLIGLLLLVRRSSLKVA